MGKPKIAGLAEIDLDEEELVPPAATGQRAQAPLPTDPLTTAPARPGRKPKIAPVEPFQLRIPPDVAQEIRMEATRRRTTHSDLVLEAWALWKRQNMPTS